MSNRLSEHVWFMQGESKSLADIEGKEVTITRYQTINTRYGEALIMEVVVDGVKMNVITSSSRVMRAVVTCPTFPTTATFSKVDGRWQIL